MPEIYTPAAIKKVPGVEVVRWLRRAKLIEGALEQTKTTWMEDWGEGGQTLDILAKAHPKDWKGQLDYQAQKLLELHKLQPRKGAWPLKQLLNPLVRVPVNLREVGTQTASRIVAEAARDEAAQTVGLYEQHGTKRSIPIGAVAMYAYWRADITQPLDRAVYDKLPELDDAFRALKPVRPTVSYYQMFYGADSLAQPGHEAYNQLWTQLTADLQRVDTRAAELSGNL